MVPEKYFNHNIEEEIIKWWEEYVKMEWEYNYKYFYILEVNNEKVAACFIKLYFLADKNNNNNNDDDDKHNEQMKELYAKNGLSKEEIEEIWDSLKIGFEMYNSAINFALEMKGISLVIDYIACLPSFRRMGFTSSLISHILLHFSSINNNDNIKDMIDSNNNVNNNKIDSNESDNEINKEKMRLDRSVIIVMGDNMPAISAYQKMGFELAHSITDENFSPFGTTSIHTMIYPFK